MYAPIARQPVPWKCIFFKIELWPSYLRDQCPEVILEMYAAVQL